MSNLVTYAFSASPSRATVYTQVHPERVSSQERWIQIVLNRVPRVGIPGGL
jgi:hypothetical protein